MEYVTCYQEFIERATRKHGDKFDASELAPEFARYFRGERVRVRFSHGEELTGTIGVTTGWRPAFLLMRRSSDVGSSHVLGAGDHVVAVKRGREYVAVVRAV